MRLSHRFSAAACFFVFQIVLACLFATTSHAWIYPEHRDITVLAIQKLDPGRRATLDMLWADARRGMNCGFHPFPQTRPWEKNPR